MGLVFVQYSNKAFSAAVANGPLSRGVRPLFTGSVPRSGLIAGCPYFSARAVSLRRFRGGGWVEENG